ncbi:hypothetical protein VP01_18g3 [Puccinia sorghi]|uniref:Uncharacterized protein n=1 Tax=Puccinia sorghi TaxID=27349 RepID=A0A0L6VDE5_9BASI|nr:hypothetical protein VP01_18g3 [Puccinia sorghi]
MNVELLSCSSIIVREDIPEIRIVASGGQFVKGPCKVRDSPSYSKISLLLGRGPLWPPFQVLLSCRDIVRYSFNALKYDGLLVLCTHLVHSMLLFCITLGYLGIPRRGRLQTIGSMLYCLFEHKEVSKQQMDKTSLCLSWLSFGISMGAMTIFLEVFIVCVSLGYTIHCFMGESFKFSLHLYFSLLQRGGTLTVSVKPYSLSLYVADQKTSTNMISISSDSWAVVKGRMRMPLEPRAALVESFVKEQLGASTRTSLGQSSILHQLGCNTWTGWDSGTVFRNRFHVSGTDVLRSLYPDHVCDYIIICPAALFYILLNLCGMNNELNHVREFLG